MSSGAINACVREPLTGAGFCESAGVSREVGERLAVHLALLAKWQKRINLVGASTLRDPWRRHVQDSAQLLPLLPPATRSLVDLGSGAGFPGMVLAILGVPDVHLIEADARKAAFLREVSRETRTPVTVHAARIEEVPPIAADVVTARALAPMPRLLPLAARFAGPETVFLFLKGQHIDRELTEATKNRRLPAEIIRSLTDPSAAIVRIRSGDLA